MMETKDYLDNKLQEYIKHKSIREKIYKQQEIHRQMKEQIHKQIQTCNILLDKLD